MYPGSTGDLHSADSEDGPIHLKAGEECDKPHDFPRRRGSAYGGDQFKLRGWAGDYDKDSGGHGGEP